MNVYPQPMTFPHTAKQPAQQPLPQINSGIQAGPVLAPQQVAAQDQKMADFAYNPAGASPFAHNADLARQYTNAVHGQTNAARIDFGRQAAQANAGQQLAGQKARANYGVGAGNLLARMQDQQRRAEMNSPQRQMLMALLGEFTQA